jgi:HPt (histidine-containing phosphotransfer) domain-containing protein
MVRFPRVNGATLTIKEELEIFDEGLALNSVGGDAEFLCEVVGLTLAALPTLLDDIRQGVAARDFGAVALASHLATVAARNVSAKRVAEAALQLEKSAHAWDLLGVEGANAWLELEVARLRLALSTLRSSKCCPAG